MRRRTFLTALGAGAASLGVTGAASADLLQSSDTIDSLVFDSTASLLNANGEPLTDDSLVAVWAEPTAYNGDDDGEENATIYPDGTPIPLVASAGTVVGVGAPIGQDDTDFSYGNEEFLLNVFDVKLGGDGTVLWDEGHDQFYTLSSHGSFEQYAEDAGYDLRATTDVLGGASLTFPSTASQVAPDGGALTDASTVMVWAEPTAQNVDDAGDEASHIYAADEEIPLVSRDGDVVGFGTPELIADGEFDGANEQFVLALLSSTVGDGGTILWDDAHDTYYDSSNFGSFAETVESEGYAFEATTESLAGGSDGGEAGDDVLVADPGTPGEPSTHTWTLEDLTFGEAGADGDEVDTITVEYDAASLDGLDQDDVTVTMTRTLSDGTDTSEIRVNQGSYSGSAATFDLSGRYQTDVAGPVVVEIDGVQNPPTSEVATITLEGDADPVSVEADLTVGDGSDGGDSALDGADLLVIPSPAEPYPDAELAAVAEHVADGGSLFLFDESEFTNEETANLDELASSLDLSFRFNADQVEDTESNAGAPYVPTTSNFNDAFDVFDGLGSAGLSDADGLVVTSPSAAFSAAERDALATFVESGGSLFLFDQSDYNDFDETANLNEVATAVGAPFRFNDDQVYDPENNAGAPFVPTTSEFNADFEYFDEREGLSLELDRDETYLVEVVSVTDGDTVDVRFEEGQEQAIRTLGFDTPETGSATSTERAEEWEGIDSYDYLETAGEAATAFAREQLSPGDTVGLSFDATEPVRDEFGRVLGYLTYDADGSGSRDTLYNRRVVEAGHARVYGSGFARHDEFLAAEFAARDAGREVWSESDPFDSSPIRDRPVEDLFFPTPTSVVTDSGPVDDDRVPVFAAPSATRSGGDVSTDGDLPLAAVDLDSRVAVFGAPLISETYEEAEGYPVDTSGYENFAFVTELLDDLSARDDDTVLIEGGHGQFGLSYSLSNEDAAYYQRYLEGRDTLFEQVNDLTTEASAERLASARALVVTTPASAFSDAELAAVASFADSGGAVVLMGSAAAPADQRGYLDEVATALDSDLRLGSGSVTDEESNLNGDPSIPVTSNLSEVDTDPAPERPPVATIDLATTEATVGERLAFRVDDTSGSGRWITALDWTFGDGSADEGWYSAHRYDEAGEYTVTLTATDNTGATTTDTVTVAVSDLSDPIARVVPSTTDASVGERVTFSVRDTSGDERWVDSLDWTFGDGTSGSGWWNAHSYGSAGSYTVTLRATDNTGATTTDTVTVTVE
ncbi:PKD domain-containing protein [Halomarina salina]|uniref:PKD domain-containing protein n=1 Tax=Halomarina salina TaxID=1872699 RepID=A0ABD5RJC8_9EURY|nr:PKD domain-containing protein [Halomarina salina]